jgi:RNA polymerase sigma-70 factor (ECF subfamily)
VRKDLFKSLFDTYYNPLCNYVANHFQLADKAEDIVMDVFAQLWSGESEIENIKSPKSYLFKATYHKAIEYWRSTKQLKLVELPENFVITDDNASDFEEYLLKEKLYQSIRQLPNKCQLIFVKAKINGLSHKQIAEELSISVKTIENQITKAYALLKKDLIHK